MSVDYCEAGWWKVYVPGGREGGFRMNDCNPSIAERLEGRLSHLHSLFFLRYLPLSLLLSLLPSRTFFSTSNSPLIRYYCWEA